MRRLILASGHTQEGILSGVEQGQVLLGSFSHGSCVAETPGGREEAALGH